MNAAIAYANGVHPGAWRFEAVSDGIVAQCVQPVHAGQTGPIGHGGMQGAPWSASAS